MNKVFKQHSLAEEALALNRVLRNREDLSENESLRGAAPVIFAYCGADPTENSTEVAGIVVDFEMRNIKLWRTNR